MLDETIADVAQMKSVGRHVPFQIAQKFRSELINLFDIPEYRRYALRGEHLLTFLGFFYITLKTRSHCISNSVNEKTQ